MGAEQVAAIIVMSFAFPAIGSSKPVAAPLSTSLCAIVSNSATYNGKLVKVRANFESDGIERSILLDPECKGSGVMPYVADNAPGARSFDEAIATGHPGTLDKTITATFTGTFHYTAKPEMCMFASK